MVYAVYSPKLIQPDGYNPITKTMQHRGTARVQSVRAGFVKIYPCPHSQYQDAMEVRFIQETADSILVRHELYMDYGPKEVETYVLNVVALDVDTEPGDSEGHDTHLGPN